MVKIISYGNLKCEMCVGSKLIKGTKRKTFKHDSYKGSGM